MTSKSAIPPAGKISKERFGELLAEYPRLIEEISAAKGAKDGQKTLQQLDTYRYHEAVDVFSTKSSKLAMTHDDVKTLVEWKLRHGKFRPTLMKLVSSNDPKFVTETIQTALAEYRKSSDAQGALDILTRLKGIGPATASLLLTVHDPDRVIFFSDEAFYWLCCDGQKSPIKYNAKEYTSLRSSAQDLSERIGASATDIEKVAYVLMKQTETGKDSTTPKAKPKSQPRVPAKRKAEAKPVPTDVGSHSDPPLRRSKRSKT